VLRVPPRRPKKEVSLIPTVETGINYLERLVAARQQQTQTELFGPTVTMPKTPASESLTETMNRLGFNLSEFEVDVVERYEQQVAPIEQKRLEHYLELILSLKGSEHHVQFYLDKLTEMQLEGGLSNDSK